MTPISKKLHLGCGSVYLPGYINIDYPVDQQDSIHTNENNSHPDEYADITTLHYSQESIDEIRLHHVFEHFSRPTALRLLNEWYDWLHIGGKLIIETPDFDRCVKAYIFGDEKQRGVILRHLYGSHDAHWAVHYDGWYKNKFKMVLTSLGFGDLLFKSSSWHSTYNITVEAKKVLPTLDYEKRMKASEELLRLGLVDESETEQNVLSVWLNLVRSKNI